MTSNQKSIVVKVEKREIEMADFLQIHMAQNQGAMEGAPHLVLQDAKMSNDQGLLQSGQANQVMIKEEKPGSFVFPPVEDVAENVPVTNMNQLGAHQMLRQNRPVSPPPGFELSAQNMNRFSHVSTHLTEARWRKMPHESTGLSFNQLNVSNNQGLLQSSQANQVINKEEKPGSLFFPPVKDVVDNVPVTNMNQLGAHQMLRQNKPVSPPPGFELSAQNMNRFSHVSPQLTEARWRNMPHGCTILSFNQLNVKPSNPAPRYPFRGLANMSLNTSITHYNREFNMIPLRYMNNHQKMPERREFNSLVRPNLINTHQSAAFNYQAGTSGGKDAYYNNLLYSGMRPATYSNQLIPAQAVTAGNVASGYYPPQGAAPQTDSLPPLLYYDPGQFHGARRRRRSVTPKPPIANPRNKLKGIAVGGEDQAVPQVSYPRIQVMDQVTREFLETLRSMGKTATASSSPLYRRRVNPPLYRRRRGSRFVDPFLRARDAYIRDLEKAAQNNRNVGNNSQNMQN